MPRTMLAGTSGAPRPLGGMLALGLVLAMLVGPGPVRAQDPVLQRLDSLLLPLSGGAVPGCAVGVARDSRVLVERAYGMADLEHDVPNDTTTIFEAGSVSKQITAAAVLLLAQRGKLKLDDEARTWLPEIPLFEGRQMTVADLLHHTSGLREWGAIAALRGWSQGSAVYNNAHVLDIVARQQALNFEPGREFLYSNTNYNLLAVLVQRVSGRTLADFSRAELFGPLGMTRTSWRDDHTRIVKRRAIAYERRGSDGQAPGPTGGDSAGGEHIAMPNEDAYGNNGLLTTVGDLLRWNEELRSGKLLGSRLRREMEQPGVLTGGRTIAYAAGLFVSSYRGVPEIWHTGAVGGYRAFLARYPESKLSVALLCNSGRVDPLIVGHRVADLFLRGADSKAAPPRARAGASLTTRGLRPVTGLFWDTRTAEPVRVIPETGGHGIGDSSPVLVISATEFRLASDPAVRIIARYNRGRPRAQLLWITPDADTSVLDPVEPFEPTTDLHDYTGEWYSPEAEVTYAFAVEDGKLVVMFRPDVRFTLSPLYADAFRARGLIFRFERDAQGRVGGLGIWMARARNVRFLRIVS